MNVIYLKKALIFTLLIFIIFLNFSAFNNVAAEPESVDVRLVVQVLDVNPQLRTASVNLHLFINNYPLNASEVGIVVTGGGMVSVPCKNEGEDGAGWFFQGESNETAWFLDGVGETYPFDSYTLHFKIQNSFTPEWINCSLTEDGSQAYFDGANYMSLTNSWARNNSLIPITSTSAWIAENQTTKQLDVSLNRTPNALSSIILELLIPIIACYFLLAATLLLDPKKYLNERLTIYLALFVFVPTFFFAIQNYLPFRASLSFPELLLSNLVISTTIIGVFSIIGKVKNWSLPWNARIHHNVWDLLAIIISFFVLLLTYCLTLFGKITPAASFVFSYCIVPAFMIWFPFENLNKRKLGEKRNVIAFFGSFISMFFWASIAWHFDSVLFLMIGGVISGVFTGLYLKVRVALISSISVIISVVLAGGIISIANALIGVDFTEVYNGILLIGLWGYPIGALAALIAIIESWINNKLTSKSQNVLLENKDVI